MKNCGLNNAYAIQLFSKISELSLSSLDLSYNNIGDEILDFLKQELEKHPSQMRMDLTGCDIDSRKTENLSELKSNLQSQDTNDVLIHKLIQLAPLYDDFNE